MFPDPDNPEFTDTPVAVNTLNSGSPTGGGNVATCDDIDPNWESYNVFGMTMSILELGKELMSHQNLKGQFLE